MATININEFKGLLERVSGATCEVREHVQTTPCNTNFPDNGCIKVISAEFINCESKDKAVSFTVLPDNGVLPSLKPWNPSFDITCSQDTSDNKAINCIANEGLFGFSLNKDGNNILNGAYFAWEKASEHLKAVAIFLQKNDFWKPDSL